MVRKLVLPRSRKKFLRLTAIITISIVGFISSVNFIINDVLKPYQRNRVYILLQLPVDDDPWADWNIKNSKTAIGNGGLLGQGYREGAITKFRFVPEQNTDFIFCTIGEEWGYVGSLTVLSLFTFLIFRLIIMAERQRSVFSRIFGYSVACILFMHVFINIGMVIGLAPVIGIPLPFFSYGGSSMMAFTVMLFIFIKLDSDRLIGLR
jgi:rod shape determining protein RodA